MSSKAEQRRRGKRQRDKKRERAELAKRAWVCPACNSTMPGTILGAVNPICLCGHVR